jgi:hypothetical protein
MGNNNHEQISNCDDDLCLDTVDQVQRSLDVFTDEQRSLAWSPEPPSEPVGPSDCRPGGSCGLNLNPDTARSRWRRARFRWNREQKGIERS